MQTLSVALQVFAVIYVVSSFLGLLWGATIVAASTRLESLGTWVEGLVANPIEAQFAIHFGLAAIYLPLAMRRVDSFSWQRQLIMALCWSCWWQHTKHTALPFTRVRASSYPSPLNEC